MEITSETLFSFFADNLWKIVILIGIGYYIGEYFGVKAYKKKTKYSADPVPEAGPPPEPPSRSHRPTLLPGCEIPFDQRLERKRALHIARHIQPVEKRDCRPAGICARTVHTPFLQHELEILPRHGRILEPAPLSDVMSHRTVDGVLRSGPWNGREELRDHPPAV